MGGDGDGRVGVVGFVYMYTRLKPHGAFSQKRQIHTVEGTRWSLATSLRSTELPINSSCMAKRTEAEFYYLWPYLIGISQTKVYKVLSKWSRHEK